MKKITLRVDHGAEMFELHVDGVLYQGGNFWDFNFIDDVPALLSKVGTDVAVEDYSYDCEEEQ